MSNEEHMHDSVFVPMCADFLHSGHLNILNIAASHGKVIILLMTNEAMRKYKRAPYFSYDQRKDILLALKVVETVIPCEGPSTYGAMVDKYQPCAFVHGDDWKEGVQSQAREDVIGRLQVYSGLLVEPQYTPGVSSTSVHKFLEGDKVRNRKIGVCVRGALNDLKRTPEVVAAELAHDCNTILKIINGEAKTKAVEDFQRMISDKYPTSVRDVYVDVDTSIDGVWVCSEKHTVDSARIFNRMNGNGENLPYYRYMDTAMASIAPFKPELIEELVYVNNNDPMNPLVVMNKGHLLTQYTYFIGPVNFYYTVRGKRICIPMNTGDSCLITPYVPHSFTSRDKKNPSNAKIVAVTFSGNVKRNLSDLVHLKADHLVKCSGNMRNVKSVRRELLLRKMELRGMAEANVSSYLLAEGIPPPDVQKILSGDGSDSIWKKLSNFFSEGEAAFNVDELCANEEVAIQTGSVIFQNGVRCLARSRHISDAGALEILVGSSLKTPMYSRFFQYLFNVGGNPIEAEWDGHTHSIEPNGSMVLKPFVSMLVSSVTGESKLFVAKVPGCVSLQTTKECALFAQEGFQMMTSNKSKWW